MMLIMGSRLIWFGCEFSPRVKIDWHNLVWVSQNIPRHAIRLWLVYNRKLKTHDNLRQWDVSSNTNLNLLQYALCEL